MKMPTKEDPIYITVFYIDPQTPPLICAICGFVSTDILSEIETQLAKDQEEDPIVGAQKITYRTSYWPGQYDHEGRCELEPYWILDVIQQRLINAEGEVMPDTIDFEKITNDELNRSAAERDPKWERTEQGGVVQWYSRSNNGFPSAPKNDHEFNRFLSYATSADAALGLAERWGYRIISAFNTETLFDITVRPHKKLDPTTIGMAHSFARALTIACCKAKQAEESADA